MSDDFDVPDRWEAYVESAALAMNNGYDHAVERWGPEVRCVLEAVGSMIIQDALNSCIWIDPSRQGGEACFGGTRVPVDPFMEIAEEAGPEAAQAFWPSVTDEHVIAGIAWRRRYRRSN